MNTDNDVLNAFYAQCDELSRKIMPGCGLSYELYQRRLSAAIDKCIDKVPAECRNLAVELARDKFEYLTPKEVAEVIRKDKENGDCCHGMHPDYCPLGCGDLDN